MRRSKTKTTVALLVLCHGGFVNTLTRRDTVLLLPLLTTRSHSHKSLESSKLIYCISQDDRARSIVLLVRTYFQMMSMAIPQRSCVRHYTWKESRWSLLLHNSPYVSSIQIKIVFAQWLYTVYTVLLCVQRSPIVGYRREYTSTVYYSASASASL